MNQLTILALPADAWLVALFDTSLRLSGILLVAGAIAMALRRSSANLRHLVWALALAGALVLPLGASYLPTLSLPVPRPLLALARVADAALGVRLSETPIPVPADVMVEETDGADVLTAVWVGATRQSVAPEVSEAAVHRSSSPRRDLAPTSPHRPPSGWSRRGSSSSSGSGLPVSWCCSSESVWGSWSPVASPCAPSIRVTVSGRVWRPSWVAGSG